MFDRLFGKKKRLGESKIQKDSNKTSSNSDMPGAKLYIGMPFDEIVRILGEPSGINPRTEMLEVGPRGKVVGFSAETVSRLARTKYCMWKRPEGIYLLIIENDKLARIYLKP